MPWVWSQRPRPRCPTPPTLSLNRFHRLRARILRDIGTARSSDRETLTRIRPLELTSFFAMMHRLQTGLPSSHLILLVRQQRHPVLVRVNFCLRRLPALPVFCGGGTAAALVDCAEAEAVEVGLDDVAEEALASLSYAYGWER
jgi:hypothetical protein